LFVVIVAVLWFSVGFCGSVYLFVYFGICFVFVGVFAFAWWV